jgi:hypothetical protein
MDTIYDELSSLSSRFKNMSSEQLAEEAVTIATHQILACSDFKKPRMARLAKYDKLYNNDVQKKLRQLFNVPIPVFAGMIDTLNAQYDTPIILTFKEGDAADYFKVEKINAAFQMEIMSTTQNSKWDSKLRMMRKHAIMYGRAIGEYNVFSDPEYKSELNVINLKNFNFQPRGGLYLENHLFAGTEDVEKTRSELIEGVKSGIYNKEQVQKLLLVSSDQDYLPDQDIAKGEKLSRFKPMGLNPDNHNYVGQSVYKLANHILEINGTRYYLCFHPWSKTWLTFDKYKEINSSELYPWVTYATHEDDENFLSKSYSDDLYPSADAIVAMFNQELTNREKRNFGARAYDKDMFTDVRKLDEAMHRPDALVPADTKGGTRRISEGVFEFKTGELQGTVNLIDWITGSLGRNTGATDLAMGGVQNVSKKASVTFAEQKSVSKRIGWGAQPFQDMMGDLGKRYIYGLRDHMPSKMAVRVLGETGWDWDEITRMDLNTTKDVDVLIMSSDQQMRDSELKSEKRKEALALIGADPNLAPTINAKWRAEQILMSVGGYEQAEVASGLDVQNYEDRKAIAKASESIQLILRGKKPEQWYGANVAFIQKIVDFASDKRATLKDKFDILMEYALSHTEIAKGNIERKVTEQSIMPQPASPEQLASNGSAPAPERETAQNPGMSGGMSKAMNLAQV